MPTRLPGSWPSTARVIAAAVLAGAFLPAARSADAPATPTPVEARELMQALLVASPYKLPDAARAGHIRYRVRVEGAPWRFPETGEQHARADADAGTTVLDICADCGRETPPDAADLARYRAPGPGIESDDRAVRVFAKHLDRGGSLQRRMLALRDGVHARMDGTIDFSRYDSAAGALARRSGDCTEAALLLAAVARARGIPARVVYGVAYSSRFTGQSHVFSPHMWVQVWDGARWRSFDAALERFDAGHIALVVGDGAFDTFAPATSIIAGLRIEAAAGITPSASADSVRP